MVEGKRTSQPLLVQEEGLEQAGPAWECTGQEVTGRHSWKAEEQVGVRWTETGPGQLGLG